MDNSGNYQWSYGYQGQDYSQEEIGFEYQRPSYYSPSKNGYEFGGSQYQGPEYQGNTIEPPYHHESLQQGHQYMSNMPQLEQHYPPSGIPDGAHYMTQGPAQEHYEYDPGQSELFRDQTVDYENNCSNQTAPPVPEMCVEEAGAFNNPIYESEQPSVRDTTFVVAEVEATPLHQSEASVGASAVVIAEVEENSLHQSTPFVGNSAIIAAEFEATLLHQPEAKAVTKNPILVSPKVVESRRFNWADDSSEEDTLVDELQSATGESVAMTNPQTSEKLEIDNEDNTDAKHNVPTKALVEVKPTSDWSASGVSATTANNQSEDRVRVESVATADIGNQKHPLATSKQEISPVFDTEELPATEETATTHRQTAPQDDNISGPQTREIVDSTVNETVIARHESAPQNDHVSVPKSTVMVTGAANETATTQHKTTQYETTTQDGHEPVPASHTTILFAVGEIPAVHSPVLAVPLVENELPKVETEENPWQTVERSAKYGRQPKLRKVYGSGAITSGRKPSSGSSWASIVSVPTAPVTPTKKTDLALDVQQKLESPGPVTAGVQQNVIRPEAKRKLYISDIPKETTYADLLHGIKGGLIDDIYLSSQSPDRHQHHQLKTGRPRSEKNDPCFAYITFYSEEGAQRCVQYLRHIDAAQGSTVSTSSKKQANTYTSMHKPVAHITLSGHRTPVYCREKDQRILQRDVVEAVQFHQGTRVLIFTFRKNIRIKLPHTGNSSTWDIWQKALSRDNGTPGLELIQRHIQVWRNTPKIDVESIELLPTITEAPATKKPSTVPKLFLGAPADQTFRVRVSLIRISVAQKVKQILEQDIMFREHCSISFAPDPCAEEFTIPEPITVPEASNTIQGDTTSGSTPGTPTKLRKKKKKAAALKIGVGVEDSEAFPPLPRSASFKTSDEMKTPTSVTLWTSKELPLAVRTRDSSVVKETEETEKPADNAEDDETKSVTSSHRSVSSTCRTIPIFGDIEAIDTGKEEGTVDMPANRKGK